jgi:protein O-GlcNAc transferase
MGHAENGVKNRRHPKKIGYPKTVNFFENAIGPEMFDIWMRLLHQVEGSVFWLLHDNPFAVANLKREAETRGVRAERLVFAPRMPPPEHLARIRLADLFLDTLPYNAHTTASDALWVGLPLVTSPGTTFPGRVAASLLHAAGMPELIAYSLAGYEALALKLARDTDALAAVKAKLAATRDHCTLFDTTRFTRHLESAYVTMWERHEKGLPPASFAVEPVPRP